MNLWIIGPGDRSLVRAAATASGIVRTLRVSTFCRARCFAIWPFRLPLWWLYCPAKGLQPFRHFFVCHGAIAASNHCALSAPLAKILVQSARVECGGANIFLPVPDVPHNTGSFGS